MATTYYSGTDGRVRVASNTNAVGISKWALQLSAPVVNATNFESATDANGNVWRQLVAPSGASGPKVGIIASSVTFEGRFNSDATAGSLTLFNIGAAVTLDLVLGKSDSYGFYNLSGVITEVSIGSDINSTEASTFSCKAELTGVLPGGTTTSA